MAKRTTARRLAMQILYQMDIAKVSLDTAFDSVVNNGEEKFSEETIKFAKMLTEATVKNLTQIDKKINEASKNWALGRMSYVDRNILRIAVCEILVIKEEKIPVIINEAVKLAKKFSGQDGHKFINGVLSFFVN